MANFDSLIAAATPRVHGILRIIIGFLFTACVIGGVAWWLTEAAGPAWAVYSSVCAAVFFSVGAIGFLLTAVVTPER